MTCYLISEIEVLDPSYLKDYLPLVASAKEKYGGRYLVRGSKPDLIEGKGEVGRMVVTEFDTVEQAMGYWNSPEYAKAKAIRLPATRCRVLLVEGTTGKTLAAESQA